MNNKTFPEMTTAEKMEALRAMTLEERISAMQSLPIAPVVVSFGKAPKNGWTDADRVPAK